MYLIPTNVLTRATAAFCAIAISVLAIAFYLYYGVIAAPLFIFVFAVMGGWVLLLLVLQRYTPSSPYSGLPDLVDYGVTVLEEIPATKWVVLASFACNALSLFVYRALAELATYSA